MCLSVVVMEKETVLIASRDLTSLVILPENTSDIHIYFVLFLFTFFHGNVSRFYDFYDCLSSIKDFYYNKTRERNSHLGSKHRMVDSFRFVSVWFLGLRKFIHSNKKVKFIENFCTKC